MGKGSVNLKALFFLWEVKRRFGTLQGRGYNLYKIFTEQFGKISKGTFYKYLTEVEENFGEVHSFFETYNLREKL